ncbi:MAG: Holliday junction branch migration protein RuvA [Clostridia bacterium]|nr:Holliday junction branch migration protein RuvA [Clostridia bacterium]
MIYHLCGEVVLCENDFAVLDVGGVGYRLTVSQNTAARIRANIGKTLKLLTHMSVREDAVELFGFRDEDELTAFKLLITVSGVGPKAAMSILSVMTPDRLAAAVCAEDAKAIAKAPGVGSKTAARVVLDLKGKLAKEFPSATNGVVYEEMGQAPSGGNADEALEALIVLGYRRAEAMQAMKGLDPSADTGALIKAALAKLMK